MKQYLITVGIALGSLYWLCKLLLPSPLPAEPAAFIFVDEAKTEVKTPEPSPPPAVAAPAVPTPQSIVMPVVAPVVIDPPVSEVVSYETELPPAAPAVIETKQLEPVHFTRDLASARAAAKATQRGVLVVFAQAGCPPCRAFENEVTHNAQAQEVLRPNYWRNTVFRSHSLTGGRRANQRRAEAVLRVKH